MGGGSTMGTGPIAREVTGDSAWMGMSLSMRSSGPVGGHGFRRQASSSFGPGKTERDASECYVSMLTWNISNQIAASREKVLQNKDAACNTENAVALVCMRCGKPPAHPGKPAASPAPKRRSKRSSTGSSVSSCGSDDGAPKLPIPQSWPMLLPDLDGDWALLSKLKVNPFFERLYIDAPDVQGGDGSTSRIKEDHRGCLTLEGGSLAVLLVRTGKSGSQMVYIKVAPDLGWRDFQAELASSA